MTDTPRPDPTRAHGRGNVFSLFGATSASATDADFGPASDAVCEAACAPWSDALVAEATCDAALFDAQSATIVAAAVDAAYPGCTGRIRDLEIVAYATAEAVRHDVVHGPASPQSGSMRRIADEAASRALIHTVARVASARTARLAAAAAAPAAKPNTWLIASG